MLKKSVLSIQGYVTVLYDVLHCKRVGPVVPVTPAFVNVNEVKLYKLGVGK
jgi:hypothetical protein